MWAVLQPLMPVRDQRKGGAARTYDDRLVLDAQSIKSSEGGQDRGYDARKKTTGRKRHLIA
jgi:hypothetical protein